MQNADTKVGLPIPCSFVALTLNKCFASRSFNPSSSLPGEKSRPVQSIKGIDALFCIILDVDGILGPLESFVEGVTFLETQGKNLL